MPDLPPFLLFDLDDTLLDYSASGARCWQELYRVYAPRLGVSLEELASAYKQVSGWYWADPERHRSGRLDLAASRRQVLRITIEKLGIDRLDLGEQMADDFTLRREPLIIPFPGALETLQEIQQRGIRMALVTNGSREFQRNKIQRFDLSRYFDVIIIEEEFGLGKPELGVFRAALDGLGAYPEQTWMVGDDLQRDIQPAQALGLQTVWVDIDGAGLPPVTPVVPERTIRSVTELV